MAALIWTAVSYTTTRDTTFTASSLNSRLNVLRPILGPPIG